MYNGKLYLACNIDDLTSDSQFGPWPNSYGCLGIDGITATINVDPFITLNDSTPPVIFYPTHEERIIGANAPPQLSDLTYNSSNGSITFFITYTDADNNLPTMHNIVIDDADMLAMIPQDHTYETGSLFSLTIPTSQINSHAQAHFSDGEYDVQSNTMYIAGADEYPSIPSSSFVISPNPYRTTVNISFYTEKSLQELRGIITNIKGQTVAELECDHDVSGTYFFEWSGHDRFGLNAANGIYFCNILSENRIINSRKILLIR